MTIVKLFSWISKTKIANKLHRIYNCAKGIAKIIYKFNRTTPVFIELHCFTIEQRIKFKLALVTYKPFNEMWNGTTIFNRTAKTMRNKHTEFRSGPNNLVVAKRTYKKYLSIVTLNTQHPQFTFFKPFNWF